MTCLIVVLLLIFISVIASWIYVDEDDYYVPDVLYITHVKSFRSSGLTDLTDEIQSFFSYNPKAEYVDIKYLDTACGFSVILIYKIPSK
jgi:hypothetical protein